jgi:hypothetical protein
MPAFAGMTHQGLLQAFPKRSPLNFGVKCSTFMQRDHAWLPAI